MSRTIAATNAASSSIANALLKRRSNPMVEIGLALSDRPHTEPEQLGEPVLDRMGPFGTGGAVVR